MNMKFEFLLEIDLFGLGVVVVVWLCLIWWVKFIVFVVCLLMLWYIVVFFFWIVLYLVLWEILI